MTVNVTEEALRPAVVHPHRPAEAQRQQARVHLQADVFAGAERTADAAQHEAHLLLGDAEAGRDLTAVLVHPLGGDVQLDATPVLVWNGERRFEPEECLVLHADVVRALDDDFACGIGVAVDDALMTEHIAVRMDRGVRTGDRPFGVEQRRQDVVVDGDRRHGAATRLLRFSGDDGDRLADVAHVFAGEHRLVGRDQPIRRCARHVVGGQHGVDAGDHQRRRRVDRHDAGVRVWRAKRCSPHGAIHWQVRRERERPRHLGQGIRAHRRVADPVAELGRDLSDGHSRFSG